VKLIFSMFFFCATAFSASGADVAGTWKAMFTSPPEQQPANLSEVVLHLKTADGRLAGMAQMGEWPGDAPLIDGKVHGDRISFTVYGNMPWRSGGSSGLPRLKFTGTIHDKVIHFVVLWDSVMISGEPRAPREFHLRAERTTEAR
jgi:hypothetical protein